MFMTIMILTKENDWIIRIYWTIMEIEIFIWLIIIMIFIPFMTTINTITIMTFITLSVFLKILTHIFFNIVTFITSKTCMKCIDWRLSNILDLRFQLFYARRSGHYAPILLAPVEGWEALWAPRALRALLGAVVGLQCPNLEL